MIIGVDCLTEHIPVGKSEAISAEKLSKLLAIERRDLRRIVEKARRTGVLICGDDSGYYFAGNFEEMTAYVQRVRGRIRTASICLAPFIRKIKESERGGS